MKILRRAALVVACITILSGCGKTVGESNVSGFAVTPTPTPQIVEVMFIPDMMVIAYDRPEVGSTESALEMIETCNHRKEMIEQIMFNFETLGYSDDRIIRWSESAIALTEQDILFYEQEFNRYAEIEELDLWNRRMEEYPVATTIWQYLIEQGYNEYVAAGILGNMMTEAGWQTLDISPYASNGSYYGICQWGPYYPGRYVDLQGQLDLLQSTIQREFRDYGSMSYESFCALENERDAAVAFARSYERCTSSSHGQRQANATTAYNYFTNT